MNEMVKGQRVSKNNIERNRSEMSQVETFFGLFSLVYRTPIFYKKHFYKKMSLKKLRTLKKC